LTLIDQLIIDGSRPARMCKQQPSQGRCRVYCAVIKTQNALLRIVFLNASHSPFCATHLRVQKTLHTGSASLSKGLGDAEHWSATEHLGGGAPHPPSAAPSALCALAATAARAHQGRLARCAASFAHSDWECRTPDCRRRDAARLREAWRSLRARAARFSPHVRPGDVAESTSSGYSCALILHFRQESIGVVFRSLVTCVRRASCDLSLTTSTSSTPCRAARPFAGRRRLLFVNAPLQQHDAQLKTPV